MKIAIIGAGWLGCHIGLKLRNQGNSVQIFEQSEVFAGSSYYNQNRLHKGFHYSRNQKTRKLCYDTFDRFIAEYSDLVEDIPNNYYVVPNDRSLIDFGTFKTIFEHEGVRFHEKRPNSFINIEGGVIVDEKYINPHKARQFFKDALSDNITIKTISADDLAKLSLEYDYVINTTNNHLNKVQNCYFELSLTLVYTNRHIPAYTIDFGSITMVDGKLFSIFQYVDDTYTVTDVEHTPLYTSTNLTNLYQIRDHLNAHDVDPIRHKIENKIQYYFPEFSRHFRYTTFYTAIKVKRDSDSADRSPIIQRDNNIISCVTGKIQGIYTLEKYLQDENIGW